MNGRLVYTVESYVCTYMYSATSEDDTTLIFSHFGLFLSDAQAIRTSKVSK